MVTEPEGPLTWRFSRVMTSGIDESKAQSQYAARSDSAAARYVGPLSPAYCFEIWMAWVTNVCWVET